MDVSNWVSVASPQAGADWRLYQVGFGAEGVVEAGVFGNANAACAFFTEQGLELRVVRMGKLEEMDDALAKSEQISGVIASPTSRISVTPTTVRR